ncbi:phosphatidylinositol synthase [Cystoisospora suis]|uniref:Phosphatidylinositol synthase n=1 Tax=Cystoisospora suis TaxID=483139 RepID=A0A2C6KL73_9APIC|nr:phosphatidylinositol synthase [Cystoisospora suis]
MSTSSSSCTSQGRILSSSSSSFNKMSPHLTPFDVFLYIPNLIGYVRLVLLILSGLCWIVDRPFFFLLCYITSQGLDGVDGEAARRLNQVSIFGACLDQVVDRLSTCLLYVLISAVYPPHYACGLFLFLLFDVGGHWIHFFASAVVGAKSHKDVRATDEKKNEGLAEGEKEKRQKMTRKKEEEEKEKRKEEKMLVAEPHWVLRVYYESRLLMCLCILCYEGFLLSLLLLSNTSSSPFSFSSPHSDVLVKNKTDLFFLSPFTLRLLLGVCTPFMLFKTLTNILQGIYGAKRLVCWGLSLQRKRLQ